MNRLTLVVAVAGTVCGILPAFAADPSHSLSVKRQFANQVISCMRKRMASDKYISYIQAAKICKEEVAKQLDGAAAGPLVAADSKR